VHKEAKAPLGRGEIKETGETKVPQDLQAMMEHLVPRVLLVWLVPKEVMVLQVLKVTEEIRGKQVSLVHKVSKVHRV
jgi:hypothetical protein